VITKLREDDDDAQLEVAKMLAKWRSRIRPAVMMRGGRRLVLWQGDRGHDDSIVYRGRKGSVTLLGDVDRRGDPGGETGMLEEVQGPGDFAPEFASGAARFRRGCAHRSGEKRRAKPCQGVVQVRGGRSGAEERGQSLLQMAAPLVNSGGAAALISAAWRRISARVLGGVSAAERGVYMDAMAWTRGKELKQNRRDFCGDLPGIRHVRPSFFGRYDMWV
jgi:hypothetical protein